MKACFVPTDILLPNKNADLEKWAVIACDQYTSQPEYWQQVEEITRDVPSSYKLIYPEVYLGEEKNRIAEIQSNMEQYLRQGTLCQKVEKGFILTERTVGEKVRIGLLGAIDLEQYEFVENKSAPVRATEGTIISRIPPRVRIREKSQLESPHVLLLLADIKDRLIGPLYAGRNKLEKLYDFELMLNGGHIRGYSVEGKQAEQVSQIFLQMQEQQKGSVLAVGDGNHSIAAAKEYWSELKRTLSEEERQSHPARYALAEVVNLYSPAIIFEPIHRIVYGANVKVLQKMLAHELTAKEAAGEEKTITVLGQGSETELTYKDLTVSQCIEKVQHILDYYVEKDGKASIDYIHGEGNLRALVEREKEAVGILLKPMQKEELFPIIRQGKVLPRKAFSMGESYEKRYYLECRKISS